MQPDTYTLPSLFMIRVRKYLWHAFEICKIYIKLLLSLSSTGLVSGCMQFGFIRTNIFFFYLERFFQPGSSIVVVWFLSTKLRYSFSNQVEEQNCTCYYLEASIYNINTPQSLHIFINIKGQWRQHKLHRRLLVQQPTLKVHRPTVHSKRFWR